MNQELFEFIITAGTVTKLLFSPDYRRKVMTALQELTQAIADIKSSAGDMASRVDNVVNDLRQAAAAPTPTPDTISATDAHDAAAQLEAVATQLRGIQAQALPVSNAPATPAQPAQPVSGAGDGTTQPASPAPVTPENPTGT
jgi:hypothetical protein